MIGHRDRIKPMVNTRGLVPVRGWRRAYARRYERDTAGRKRTAALNAATAPRRMYVWAMRLLNAGVKPAQVQRMTGIEIVAPKKGDADGVS